MDTRVQILTPLLTPTHVILTKQRLISPECWVLLGEREGEWGI